ncbi:6-phospho-beta-glucosidase [Streptomyces zingiberis]|uniref:6-phospho-beta-glucosidase n=1 Tax=Streptomyces zingiberis TaxID=2053010 RepID=A0ABX1C3L6_9ACTN|nr:6-phospho-beta-glucosidase [Streptomyces zingiberis]NJQ03386.1 6-phospho-beta-glucosidase [Streptomyces zingiberis]
MRLAVVGGGSTYTPELAEGFARLRDTLPVDELVLVDPDRERLALVGGLARRIFARRGHPGRITLTGDLDAGVEGADAVLLQLRVGGQAARQEDERWPLECGCVGQETTGAGGLAKALRTVPVVLDIAERVRRRSPHAWIVDFTNPVSIVTRALLTAGHRAVGLCNVAIGLQRRFAALLGTDPAAVSLDHVGLNHLTWVRGVRVAPSGGPGPGGGEGQDLLPKLLAEHGETLADAVGLPHALLARLGAVPSYYLRYYYRHDAVVREQREKPSRAAEVAGIERELLELYADPALDHKPELLSRRGGAYYSEAAVALTAALLGPAVPRRAAPGAVTGGGTDRSGADGTPAPARVQVVNTFNEGTLPFLPDDAVIEVPAQVGPGGARPLPVRPLEPLYTGLIAQVAAYERLALDAALRGGRDRVFTALLGHPLIGQTDRAERLTDALIAHNRDHLAWA